MQHCGIALCVACSIDDKEEVIGMVSATHIKSSLRRIASTNSADTYQVSVQFCGNLPLLNCRVDTQECILQRTKTAVDPRVGVPTLFASHTATVTPPQDDDLLKLKTLRLNILYGKR